jgi:hypothetical protein
MQFGSPVAATKTLMQYSLAGAIACVAAVGGVFGQVMLSQPAGSATDTLGESPSTETA